MDTQSLIVYAILAVCLLFALRRAVRFVRGMVRCEEGKPSCGGCRGCSSSEPKLVQLQDGRSDSSQNN